MHNTCPVCGKDDQIQKLEAIVSHGISTGRFSGPTGGAAYVDGKIVPVGGYTTLTGTTATDLARKLSPPPAPAKPSGFGCWWILIIMGLLLLPTFMGSSAAVILGGVMSSVAYPASSATQDALGVTWIVMTGLATVAFFALSAVLGWYALKKDKKKRAREQVRYATERPAWEAAMSRYARLYFCFRDNLVFDPTTGETSAPESLTSFVYARGGAET